MTLDLRHTILPASIVAMSATGWLVVSRLGESPWGVGHAHALHHGAAPFIGGWVAMTVAMMLPTTLPLVQIFRRLTASRHDSAQLVLLLVAGYLAVWAAFGALVYAVATALQAAAAGVEWLAAHPRVPTVALFLVAGAFQFSDLKYRCLDKCRSPLSFVTSRWRGRHERWQSLRLGIEHGAFCVGCCWALMLLMFASAVASLWWMLLLGAVMAIEKNAPWGRRASRPVGIALLGSACIMLVV